MAPRRVDGEAPALDASRPIAKSVRKGELSEGAQVFEDSIASAPVEEQARLRELCAWARGLEAEGVVRLESFRGVANRWVLLLRLAVEDVGFAAYPSGEHRQCQRRRHRRTLL